MKYYLHDTNSFNDEKITELYLKFGYEGLGLFYTILEKIAYQEQPVKTEVLKAQLKVGKKLEKCWKFMESLGIVSSNNGETFNEKLLNNSEKYLIKKEKNRKRVANFREKQADVMRTKQPCNAYVTPSKISKDKISKDKLNNTKVLEQAHGREDINFVIGHLKEKLGVSLDGTVAENRRYAKLLIDRFKKDYPDLKPTDQIQHLIEYGLQDNFHAKNITNIKYLYYNAQKIIQSLKNNNNVIVKI